MMLFKCINNLQNYYDSLQYKINFEILQNTFRCRLKYYLLKFCSGNVDFMSKLIRFIFKFHANLLKFEFFNNLNQFKK